MFENKFYPLQKHKIKYSKGKFKFIMGCKLQLLTQH